MKRGDILPVRTPHALATASLCEEPHPHDQITAIGAQTVRRAHAHRRAGPEEAVEIVIIAAVIAENEGYATAQPRSVRRRDRGGAQIGTFLGNDRPTKRARSVKYSPGIRPPSAPVIAGTGSSPPAINDPANLVIVRMFGNHHSNQTSQA